MSEKVTIGAITEDLLPFTEKGNQVIPVEIIPRKIVDNTIAYCLSQINDHQDDTAIDAYKKFAYDDVKQFIEKQLKKFDEA